MFLTDELTAKIDAMKATLTTATGAACKDLEDAISELNAGTALYQDRMTAVAQQTMNASEEYGATVGNVMAKLATIKKGMAAAPAKAESPEQKSAVPLGLARAA